MGNRGRPSSAALAVLPSLERVDRLKPEPGLTDEQVEVWGSIVNEYPAGHFTGSASPLLSQLARHVVNARLVAERIERLLGRKGTTTEDLRTLFRMQAEQSSCIAILSTKLAITPKSQTNFRGNKKPNPARKLWEEE